MLVTLCGGVGAARFLSGLVQVVPPTSITAIVNTGDDLVLHGLTICPDLDTISYTLAGLNNEETGWGVVGESWRTMERLRSLGGAAWFALGDLDLATHLFRSELLRQGATLTDATQQLTAALGIEVTVLPATNDPVATKVTLAETGEELDFQDYFVGRHHEPRLRDVRFEGVDASTPAPSVLSSIANAELLIIAPSNPIVSLGPILAIPGLRDAVETRRSTNVAISPIVAGAALKGPAADMLSDLGHEPTAVGVARLYAPLAATFILDEADAAHAPEIEALGMTCRITNTVMSSPAASSNLASIVLGVTP